MRDIWERERQVDKEVVKLVNLFLQGDPDKRPSVT